MSRRLVVVGGVASSSPVMWLFHVSYPVVTAILIWFVGGWSVGWFVVVFGGVIRFAAWD